MKTHAKTHGLRRFLCGLTALATAALMVPLSAMAETNPPDTDPDENGVTVGKSATDLDANNQTTVTLNINAGHDPLDKAAVLFVFDKSTSHNMRNAADDFINELNDKLGADLKVAVVDFYKDAHSSGWQTWDPQNPNTEIFHYNGGSGTNYHAGLEEAQELLNEAVRDGYTPYLITVSDGITYIWNETIDGTETAAAVWANCDDIVSAGSSTQQAASSWEFRYRDDNGIHGFEYRYPSTDEKSSIELFLEDAPNLYSASLNAGVISNYDTITVSEDRIAVFQYANTENGKKGDTVGYVEDWRWEQNEKGEWHAVFDDTAIISAQNGDEYLISPEAAVYKTATTFEDIVNSYFSSEEDKNHVFALKMQEDNNATNWASNPYGEELMDYMATLTNSSLDDEEIANTADAAENILSDIADQIVYSIESGTVTDIIGEDFNFAGIDTLSLSVNGVRYAPTYNYTNNTVQFYNPNGQAGESAEFTVSYVTNSNGEEVLTWDIDEEISGSVSLSYKLNVEPSSLPTGGATAVLPTNESAVLEYTGTDGTPGTLPFPEPSITIGSEPEQGGDDDEDDDPPIVIPDNPSLTIRKIWENDSASDRPDSITVDIYHDGEYYDSMVISGRRFGDSDTWRDSYDIPARYEDDDWWVVESDVPAYYDSDVEEIRENVFYITNTYEEPVIEEPVSSEPESSEPSSEPSEVIPSGPSEEPSSEPTSEPSEPAEPTLPQTGQTWWPIIILLAGGAVLVAFGAFRTIRGNGRRER